MKHLYLYYIIPLLMAVTCAGCERNAQDSSLPEDTVAATETAAVTETEETAPPPTNAPFPEADPNAVTFDEVGEDIAVVVADDEAAANGTLSIESVEGNRMLKFTDTSTTAENMGDMVQKLSFNMRSLLSPEDIERVSRIEFDLYAEAKDTLFVGDDDISRQVPGWIGGGGGTVTADDEWYGFADFSGSGLNEYDLERSDACHVTFKFLLAASGKKWDASMTEPNFLVMRWGMQNRSDIYIDNLTFYDTDGNSIPLSYSGSAEGGDATETADSDSTDMTDEESNITDVTAGEDDTTEETEE